MEQEYNSFNIIYCKEVSSGLQYNNSCGTIEYRGEKYTIKKSVYYVKKKLQNVDVYRSDGIISYTKREVESDKKLANYLGIPLVRIVVINFWIIIHYFLMKQKEILYLLIRQKI